MNVKSYHHCWSLFLHWSLRLSSLFCSSYVFFIQQFFPSFFYTCSMLFITPPHLLNLLTPIFFLFSAKLFRSLYWLSKLFQLSPLLLSLTLTSYSKAFLALFSLWWSCNLVKIHVHHIFQLKTISKYSVKATVFKDVNTGLICKPDFGSWKPASNRFSSLLPSQKFIFEAQLYLVITWVICRPYFTIWWKLFL